MTPLSQKNPRWGEEYLGFSKVKIKDFGCLITALAIQANTTPDKVNEILKANEGYAELNLVIWAKVKHIPGLEFEWRGWTYDNKKVLETIEKYGSCIVEVDFDNIISTPKDSHFVLFIGNKKLIDPWTGKIESTSKYKIIKSYVIVKTKGQPMGDSPNMYKGLDLTNQASMKVAVDVWAELRDGKYVEASKYDKEVERANEAETESARLRREIKVEKETFAGNKKALQAEIKRQQDIAKGYYEIVAMVASKLDTTQDFDTIKQELERVLKIESDGEKAIDKQQEDKLETDKKLLKLQGELKKFEERLRVIKDFKVKELSQKDADIILESILMLANALVKRMIMIARSR